MYVEDRREDTSICNSSGGKRAGNAKKTEGDDGSRPCGQLLARTWTVMAFRARNLEENFTCAKYLVAGILSVSVRARKIFPLIYPTSQPSR